MCSGWKCIAAWGRLGKCIAIGKNCIVRVCSGWENCIATRKSLAGEVVS